jgi:hypothetical protein
MLSTLASVASLWAEAGDAAASNGATEDQTAPLPIPALRAATGAERDVRTQRLLAGANDFDEIPAA